MFKINPNSSVPVYEQIEQNIIEYGSKTVKLDELLAELASKDSKEVAKYLVENTSLPRELRTNALRLVLNDYVNPDHPKHKQMEDEICKRMKFNSLQYHRLDDLIASIGLEPCKLCTYCFDGKEEND